MEEVWKDISNYEGYYQVSNKGRVKRLSSTVVMRNQFCSWEQSLKEYIFTPCLDSKGYPQVVLSIGEKRTARVHRLVAEAFLPEPTEAVKEECKSAGLDYVLVNHKDSNRSNNNVENLEWTTPLGNILHCHEQGNANKEAIQGENSYCHILSEEDVSNILDLLGKGVSQQTIADAFGVKQITISNIKTGRSWAWFTGIKRKARSYKKKQNCH